MVLVTIITLAGSGLSVMSTMTTTVLERRKEIGMMKAIGAQNNKIASIFYTEAGALGLAGGVFGYLLGFLMAQAVGKSVFNTFISFHLAVIPITVISTILLSLNLDRTNGKIILDLFKKLHKKGHTIVIVTHDPEIGRIGDRLIRLMDGKVVSEGEALVRIS